MWKSFRYRKLMGLTPAEYDETPALIVDWDLELWGIEQRETARQRKAAQA
jgi:hypothetical protein